MKLTGSHDTDDIVKITGSKVKSVSQNLVNVITSELLKGFISKL